MTGNVEDAGVPSVEAIVRDERGRYSRRPVHLTPEGSEFCVGGILFLVVSNSHQDPGAALVGASTIERVNDLHCELPAGELFLEMDGQYDDPPTATPVTIHAQVEWHGSLGVHLEQTEDDGTPAPLPALPGADDGDPPPSHDEDGGVRRSSGAGSLWSVHGSFRSERCSPYLGCAGHVVEQRIEGQATLGGKWGETEDGGYLTAEMDDSGVRLLGQLPVTITTDIHHPSLETSTETHDELWPLTCHTDRPFYRSSLANDFYHPPESGTVPTGQWDEDGRSEVHFDCSHTWQPTVPGASGTVTFGMDGTLVLDD